MRCPFPGMDPYLEDPAYLPGFHSKFLTYLCDRLLDGLPNNYMANLGERANVIDLNENLGRQVIPDIGIDRDRFSDAGPFGAGAGGVALAEPETLPLVILDEPTEGYIEIVHLPDRELVAVIELLSPTNKSGAGREQYLTRRNALLLREVHLVELDFLVGGERIPLGKPMRPCHYCASVSRRERRPLADVYSWTVDQPLPALPIPLKQPDPDLRIDLQAVFAQTYERGRYGRALPYGQPPKAPLPPGALAWARQTASAVCEK